MQLRSVDNIVAMKPAAGRDRNLLDIAELRKLDPHR